ncbi:nucleosome assembly protein 1;3-like, partial [Carica papaya]|uniref:nucleosome assembly protein 1;3-like n=1 Tax=Carica papaya TaxID=3649 RepID=UPI000B8C923E
MSGDKDTFTVAELNAALNEEGRAGLVNVLKNKLQNLAGQHSDALENLSAKVKKRVEVLMEIQACQILYNLLSNCTFFVISLLYYYIDSIWFDKCVLA